MASFGEGVGGWGQGERPPQRVNYTKSVKVVGKRKVTFVGRTKRKGGGREKEQFLNRECEAEDSTGGPGKV